MEANVVNRCCPVSRTIEVKALPKAKHDKVESAGADSYKVWTTAPADKGAANAAVAKLLAKELGVAPSRLLLKHGATSRQKLFELLDS